MKSKSIHNLLIQLKTEGYDILKAYVGKRGTETYWLPEKTDSLEDFLIRGKITGCEDTPMLLIDDILKSGASKPIFNGIVHYHGKNIR